MRYWLCRTGDRFPHFELEFDTSSETDVYFDLREIVGWDADAYPTSFDGRLHGTINWEADAHLHFDGIELSDGTRGYFNLAGTEDFRNYIDLLAALHNFARKRFRDDYPSEWGEPLPCGLNLLPALEREASR